MNVDDRATIHAALGDRHRLAMIDELLLSDRTFQELADLVGVRGNLAAHHLGVLETAGLVERGVSEGDHRRRYVSMHRDRLFGLVTVPLVDPERVLFVCTHNSARSQFAAAFWHQRTGRRAESAGTHPAPRVHPNAIRAAAGFGVDLGEASPRGYDAVDLAPALVVSVCDRAREAPLPFSAPSLHWSVADPAAAGTVTAFRSAFADISNRIDAVTAPRQETLA